MMLSIGLPVGRASLQIRISVIAVFIALGWVYDARDMTRFGQYKAPFDPLNLLNTPIRLIQSGNMISFTSNGAKRYRNITQVQFFATNLKPTIRESLLLT